MVVTQLCRHQCFLLLVFILGALTPSISCVEGDVRYICIIYRCLLFLTQSPQSEASAAAKLADTFMWAYSDVLPQELLPLLAEEAKTFFSYEWSSPLDDDTRRTRLSFGVTLVVSLICDI